MFLRSYIIIKFNIFRAKKQGEIGVLRCIIGGHAARGGEEEEEEEMYEEEQEEEGSKEEVVVTRLWLETLR